METALYMLGALFLIAMGVFLEHYLGPWPKLDTGELCAAFDLIDIECDYDYERIHAMREELWSWMTDRAAGEEHLSKALQHIIKTVQEINMLNQ